MYRLVWKIFYNSVTARQILYDFFRHLHRDWNSITNLVAQSDDAFAIQSRGFAPDQVQIPCASTKCSNQLQQAHRRQSMRVDDFVLATAEFFRVECEQVNRSRVFTARRRVEQNGGIVIVHYGVSEIVRANSEVHDVYTSWPRSFQQFCRNGTAESVIAEKDVSYSSDENTFHSKINRIALQTPPDRGFPDVKIMEPIFCIESRAGRFYDNDRDAE